VKEELERVLKEIVLSSEDTGGKISFYGADPIVDSTIRLGAGSAIGLMEKSVADTNIIE